MLRYLTVLVDVSQPLRVFGLNVVNGAISGEWQRYKVYFDTDIARLSAAMPFNVFL